MQKKKRLYDLDSNAHKFGRWRILVAIDLRSHRGWKMPADTVKYCEQTDRSGRNVRLVYEGDQLTQMDIYGETVKILMKGSVEKTVNSKALYKEEIPFLAACLEQMGVGKEEAKDWMENFTFQKKTKTGTIGDCAYTIEAVEDHSEIGHLRIST